MTYYRQSKPAPKAFSEADISRKPALNDWTDYRSKQLKFISDDRIGLTNTFNSIAINFAFLLFGFIAIGWGVSVLDNNERGWIGILAGTFFIIATLIYFSYLSSRGRGAFDKTLGWFWLGSPRLTCTDTIRNLPHACQLKNVAGIQILEVPREGYDDYYYIWEMNLVRHNTTRVHVMVNEDKQSIMTDAQALSDFLSVPIFTHTEHTHI